MGLVSYEYLNTKLGGSSAGFSADGGIYITLINNTGGLSVKGTLVSACTTQDYCARITPASSDQPLGVILENGVGIGQPVKIAIAGKAYVLLKNGTAATRGNWVGVSDVAGRAYMSTDPSSTTEHWKEIGHCVESVTAGTNKLALCVLHFN